MRRVLMILLVAALVVPAGAKSTRQQCTQACGRMIATCATNNTAAGFGNLAKGCQGAVLRRCRTEGAQVCGAFCGNGVVDGTEVCDGTALGGASCASVGFVSGNLACTAACAFNTSGCVRSGAPTCGNGTVEPPEQCDGTALGGASCGSLGFTLGGTLACTAGCGFNVSGCTSQRFPETGETVGFPADKNDGIASPVSVPDDGTVQAGKSLAYTDNFDGTITDLSTGLMWEQKDDAGGLHDKDNQYRWSGDGMQETIWDWLEDVNAEGGTGLARHTDWRIPNVKELQSLVSYGRPAPTIEPVFNSNCIPTCAVPMFTCGCTASASYWSSSTYQSVPTGAWFVAFLGGGVSADSKVELHYVRAVRGGS